MCNYIAVMNRKNLIREDSNSNSIMFGSDNEIEIDERTQPLNPILNKKRRIDEELFLELDEMEAENIEPQVIF